MYILVYFLPAFYLCINYINNIICVYMFMYVCMYVYAFQVALMVKNPPVNAGDLRDAGSIPGSGRSPGEGNRKLLRCSCLGNPMERGAWQDNM